MPNLAASETLVRNKEDKFKFLSNTCIAWFQLTKHYNELALNLPHHSRKIIKKASHNEEDFVHVANKIIQSSTRSQSHIVYSLNSVNSSSGGGGKQTPDRGDKKKMARLGTRNKGSSKIQNEQILI